MIEDMKDLGITREDYFRSLLDARYRQLIAQAGIGRGGKEHQEEELMPDEAGADTSRSRHGRAASEHDAFACRRPGPGHRPPPRRPQVHLRVDPPRRTSGRCGRRCSTGAGRSARTTDDSSRKALLATTPVRAARRSRSKSRTPRSRPARSCRTRSRPWRWEWPSARSTSSSHPTSRYSTRPP